MITTLMLLTLLAGTPQEPSPQLRPSLGPTVSPEVVADEKRGFVICNPPAFGTWWVFQDCLLLGAHSVPSHVVVFENVTLTLAAGASLDIDFDNRFLRIRDQARVIVGPGARIH